MISIRESDSRSIHNRFCPEAFKICFSIIVAQPCWSQRYTALKRRCLRWPHSAVKIYGRLLLQSAIRLLKFFVFEKKRCSARRLFCKSILSKNATGLVGFQQRATQRLTPQSCFATLAQRAVQEAIANKFTDSSQTQKFCKRSWNDINVLNCPVISLT